MKLYCKNPAARIFVNSSHDASASTLFQMLMWPFINVIITGEILAMLYKPINNRAHNYFANLLTKISSTDIITIRSSDTDLYVPFMNTKNGYKAFSNCDAHTWNDLKPSPKEGCSLFTLEEPS